MKHIQQCAVFLAAFFLAAVLTCSASAFTIASTDIDPRGPQEPGTTMTVTAAIDFSPQGNETFPQEGELQLNTDLTNAYWVPVLVLGGVETHLEKTSGGTLVVPGWYLSYPAGQVVQLRVTLIGKIPQNPSVSQDLLRVQDTDAEKSLRTTARIAMPEEPIATLSTPTMKPTTRKIPTPLPTAAATTTQESPSGIGAGILALAGAGLIAAHRK